MGRNRIPTAIQDAKGAFIHKPSRKREDEPTSDRPLGDAPRTMSKEERKVWKQLAAQLLPGVALESDRLLFALLVRLATKFHAGTQMMAAETAQMIQLSSKFAMNPADRSKVVVAKPKESALAKFLQQRSAKAANASPIQ